ncbi:hypothetical protein JG688_00016407, partial [Phytophthora aleatoria]
ELRQRFVLGGVVPVSLRDLASLWADLTAEFRNAISCIQPSRECEAVTPIETPLSDWRTWQWGDGELGDAVPKGWEFPAHTSVKQMDTGIWPHKLLTKQHDIQPNHQMRHSRVRKVMQHIIDFVHGAGVLPEGVANISSIQLAAADKDFDAVFKMMLPQLYTSVPKRSEEITVKIGPSATVYNLWVTPPLYSIYYT